jgi:hypothetical protein
MAARGRALLCTPGARTLCGAVLAFAAVALLGAVSTRADAVAPSAAVLSVRWQLREVDTQLVAPADRARAGETLLPVGREVVTAAVVTVYFDHAVRFRSGGDVNGSAGGASAVPVEHVKRFLRLKTHYRQILYGTWRRCTRNGDGSRADDRERARV